MALFRERQAAFPTILLLLWIGVGWGASFILMGASAIGWNIAGVLLCAHSMLLAAYMIHEAAHQCLFATAAANQCVGECLSFVAGSSYASFERIRHMHIRHHRDRADLACYDGRRLMRRFALLRRVIEAMEWVYIPAAEFLAHLQVICRPMLSASQRCYLPRVLAMLLLRSLLVMVLISWSLKAALLYLLAYGLLLQVLNFFDAFHHTFEQYFLAADAPVPGVRPDRAYEMAHTYSNLLSTRWPWTNALILNFCYHNAHHERASAPWYRLPALHRSIYGDAHPAVMPMRELLLTWHRNRVRRVFCEDYAVPREGSRRADTFVGAHGVSFLTVV